MARTSEINGPALTQPILGRLQSFTRCSAERPERVSDLVGGVEVIAAKTVIHEGDPHFSRPRFLLEGWACHYQDLLDGRRQIFDLLLPGDSLGLCVSPTVFTTASVLALTPLRLADAGPAVSDEGDSDPPALFKAQAHAERTRALRHIMRLGRMTALERIADVFLELRERLEPVGLTDGPRFACPLTQETLADMTGLSVVHVNRTLQELRRRDMVMVERGQACVKDVRPIAGPAVCPPPGRSPTGAGGRLACLPTSTHQASS